LATTAEPRQLDQRDKADVEEGERHAPFSSAERRHRKARSMDPDDVFGTHRRKNGTSNPRQLDTVSARYRWVGRRRADKPLAGSHHQRRWPRPLRDRLRSQRRASTRSPNWWAQWVGMTSVVPVAVRRVVVTYVERIEGWGHPAPT
jgi:hypothetical protein